MHLMPDVCGDRQDTSWSQVDRPIWGEEPGRPCCPVASGGAGLTVGAPARLRMPRPILPLACRALAETIRVPALSQQVTDLSLSPWLSTALRPYMSSGTRVSRTVTGTNRHMFTTANLNKHVS